MRHLRCVKRSFTIFFLLLLHVKFTHQCFYSVPRRRRKRRVVSTCTIPLLLQCRRNVCLYVYDDLLNVFIRFGAIPKGALLTLRKKPVVHNKICTNSFLYYRYLIFIYFVGQMALLSVNNTPHVSHQMQSIHLRERLLDVTYK